MGQVLGLGLIAGEHGKGAVDRPPSPAAQLVQGPLVARLGKAKQRRDALPASGQERPRQLVRVLQLSDQFIRHYNSNVYIASNGGTNAWDSPTSWTDDVSWAVSPPWA